MNPILRRRWVVVCMIVGLLPVLRVHAADAPPEERFLRFDEDDNGGGRLQTAIRTYKNADGVTVHLVAAVHIADPGYYKDLNKIFEGYDALLYEMVKPKDKAPPGPGAEPSDSPISTVQRAMKDFLDLDFQLDDIDYSAKNFVHADLTAEEFNKKMADRGDTMLTLMLKMMMKEMNKQDNGDNANAADDELTPMALLHALTSPDRARDLKLLLAAQFSNIDAQVAAMQGDAGDVIVTERNKAAFSVLKDTIKSGKKDLGIFYGAAHMNDMESRLKDLGFKETDVQWKTAWDMTIVSKHRKKAAAPATPAA